MVAPGGGSEDKEHLITMVCPHMGWLAVLEEAGLMLDFVEIDWDMGT